jgi:hypothetical protein
MDWQLAITRNREALTAIIMALIRSLGLAGLTSPLWGEVVRRTGDGALAYTLPLHIYCRALAILRPAESAVRRLIMIAAHEMALRGVKLRVRRQGGLAEFLSSHRPNPHSEPAIPAFRLIDPLKAFGEIIPDFEVVGQHQSFDDNDAPSSTTRICAITLSRRLLALKHALENLPKQAKRLARWYVQRDAALQNLRPHRLSPVRPGAPVGLPKTKRSEIQEILLECHLLAIHACDQHDSS